MARDDFEPETDDQEDGSEETESADAAPTDEERAALKILRETGLSPAEAAERAKRDYQREHQGDARPRVGESREEQQPKGAMTNQDRAHMVQEARITALAAVNRARSEEIIENAISAHDGMEDMPAEEVAIIKDMVGTEILKDVTLPRMSQGQYSAMLKKLTGEIIAKRRQVYGGGSGDKAERDRRKANMAANDGGGGSGAGKKSAGTTRRASDEEDEAVYGVGTSWPTEADLASAKQKDLENFRRSLAAGR